MAALQCPFKDWEFLKSVLPMELHHLQQIADHIASENCPHPHMKDFVFGRNPYYEGTTPLILACQHGELDSVKSLVETWGVDVRQPGTYYTDPSKNSSYYEYQVDSVTPLFVAAFHGYDQIVRYLLQKGADVSARTSNENGPTKHHGLTPLYAAVTDRLFNSQRKEIEDRRCNIVRSLLEFGADPIADSFRPSDGKPMWLRALWSVKLITLLINLGIDMKRRNQATGETLLHSVASRFWLFSENGSFTIAFVQLLIGNGADLLARDKVGFTPLLSAADDKSDDGLPNSAVLDFLLEREEYGMMEKIEAMELAGATIFLRATNAHHFRKAFEYWHRSLHLRHEAAEEGGTSYKKIIGPKMARNVEWTTSVDLSTLQFHPKWYTIQAFFVKLRILSFDGDRHRSLSTMFIDYVTESTILGEREKFALTLDIRWGMYDVIIRQLNPLPIDEDFWIQKAVDIEELVSTLSDVQDNYPLFLNFEKLKTYLDLILLATDLSPIDMGNDILNLLEIIFRQPEFPTERKNTTGLFQSLRLLGPYRLGNVLIPACQKLGYFKSLALVRFLLEAGADPNVSVENLHGNATLHFAAMVIDRKLGDAACRLLVEFGAKLHQLNKAGKTALDIWIERNETEDNWNEEAGGWSARPEWCCPLPTLLHLAARVIRVHKLPYADGATPANLHSLIELAELR